MPSTLTTDPQGSFISDGEQYRFAIAGRRGLGRGVQVEVVIPLLSYGGGFLDSVIEGFHDEFGLGQAGRTGVARDGFQVFARGPETQILLEEDPGLQIGDIVLGAKFRLFGSEPHQKYDVALEALAELPTGSGQRLAGNESPDFGVQLLVTRYFRRACLTRLRRCTRPR